MRKEIYSAHRDVDWVKWQCSGDCETSVVASRNVQVWCGQVGCHGTMKIHRELSSQKVAKEVYDQVRGTELAPLSLSACRGVSPSVSLLSESRDISLARAFQVVEDWIGKRVVQGKKLTVEIQKTGGR